MEGMDQALIPPRSCQALGSQVSLPNSPSWGTTWKRQTSLPVLASKARMSPGRSTRFAVGGKRSADNEVLIDGGRGGHAVAGAGVFVGNALAKVNGACGAERRVGFTGGGIDGEETGVESAVEDRFLPSRRARWRVRGRYRGYKCGSGRVWDQTPISACRCRDRERLTD